MCHIPNVVLYIYMIVSECGICFAVTILFFLCGPYVVHSVYISVAGRFELDGIFCYGTWKDRCSI
jgi:hypothetical protein